LVSSWNWEVPLRAC